MYQWGILHTLNVTIICRYIFLQILDNLHLLVLSFAKINIYLFYSTVHEKFCPI